MDLYTKAGIDRVKKALKNECKKSSGRKRLVIGFLAEEAEDTFTDDYMEFIMDVLLNGCKGWNQKTEDELIEEWISSNCPKLTKKNYKSEIDEFLKSYELYHE